MSNAITDKPDGFSLPGPPGGPGPSSVREDEPGFARTVGMFGAALVIFGGMALGFHVSGWGARVGPGLSLLVLALGLAGMLFHAAFDSDIQFRRMYGLFSAACLAAGVVLCVVPRVDGDARAWGAHMHWGVPLLLLGLFFYLAFLRHETNASYLNIAQLAIGGTGAAFALVGLGGGAFVPLSVPFFVPIGFVFALCGLVLLAAFVSTRGIADDLGWYAALAVAGLGAAALLAVLGRSLVTTGGSTYFVASGLLVATVAFAYLATGSSLAFDTPFFVLFRRELASFFVSPLAYVSLFGFGLFAWLAYIRFIGSLAGGTYLEPVVAGFIIDIPAVFAMQFIPPLITMRLLSEERRAGTMEVLLTAPVDESTVVLAKFAAGMVTFLTACAPFALVLAAIPLNGGTVFDYRPLLSFFIALLASGAMFVAAGLFCSSLTSSQIASGLLAFGAMMLFTNVHFAIQAVREEGSLKAVLTHVSYLNLWIEALRGKVIVKFLLFPISLTVFLLFATVKVLESRKWR